MSSGEQDLSGYLEPLIHHELSFLAEVDSAPDQHFYKPHVVRGRLEIIGLKVDFSAIHLVLASLPPF